jgi:hypothetical protein
MLALELIGPEADELLVTVLPSHSARIDGKVQRQADVSEVFLKHGG